MGKVLSRRTFLKILTSNANVSDAEVCEITRLESSLDPEDRRLYLALAP